MAARRLFKPSSLNRVSTILHTHTTASTSIDSSQTHQRPKSHFSTLLQSSTPSKTSSIIASAAQVESGSNTIMTSSKEFLDAIKSRRSIYAINDKSPVSDEKIEEIVKDAILHTPSSFNSQSTRLVVLLKDDHKKFWDLVKEALRPLVPAEQFAATEKKLAGFRGGYGSILFYEDQKTVAELEAQYAIYAERFQPWSEHTSAMHQLVLWTALELEGFGANLQHYNPVVDAKAAETWGVPEGWHLKAQLVFGGKVADASEKSFKSVEDRYKIFGK